MTAPFLPVDSDAINRALATAPPATAHLWPIWEAVRDDGLILATVPQGERLQKLPRKARNHPTLVIIGDDLHRSMGPEGFPRKTLKLAFRNAASVSLMIGIQRSAYAEAVNNAVFDGTRSVVIETRVEHETAWLAYVHKHAPGAHKVIVTPNVAAYSPQHGRA